MSPSLVGEKEKEVNGDNPVEMFWTVLEEMAVVDRRRVLRFVTGTTRVPLGKITKK